MSVRFSILNEGLINPHLPTNMHKKPQNNSFFSVFVSSRNKIIEVVSGPYKVRFS